MPAAALFVYTPALIGLPLLGIVTNLLCGRKLGERGIGWVACGAVGLTFALAVGLATTFSSRPDMAPLLVPMGEWIHSGDLRVAWELRVDTLSLTMLLVVTGVGTLIHVYAVGYMHKDVHHHQAPERFGRFFIYFNLFIVAMVTLVSANNFLVLFVGWEGVGLCSYLLIGFWFEKGSDAQGITQDGDGNARAGKKAFITNRIGDFGLLIAIFLIFWNTKALDFDTVFSQAGCLAPSILLAITLFMLLGVAGKSAQIPLYVWLPDAMAGPTPVSALIHAATMVTAGVYLLVRCQPLYALAPVAGQVVTWMGALTALFAAVIAVGQYDIKKVLAYSTISQLGFMVAAAGMGAPVASIFHLITHAFFKALLFLAAGLVILGLEGDHDEHNPIPHPLNPQDMRLMGGLRGRMPVTYIVYVLGALALCGIAPLAGFFSKDEILATAYHSYPLIFLILALAAFLTAFYMGRQLALVFNGVPRSREAAQAKDPRPPVITTPLIALAILAVVGGVLNLPTLHTLEHWLEPSLAVLEKTPFTWQVALLSMVLALAGLMSAWFIYGRRKLFNGTQETVPFEQRLGRLFTAIQNKFWIDAFYDAVIIQPFYQLADLFGRSIDQDFIDGMVNGSGSLVRRLAVWGRRWQNGYIRSYALTFLLGVVLLVAFLIYQVW